MNWIGVGLGMELRLSARSCELGLYLYRWEICPCLGPFLSLSCLPLLIGSALYIFGLVLVLHTSLSITNRTLIGYLFGAVLYLPIAIAILFSFDQHAGLILLVGTCFTLGAGPFCLTLV